MYKRLSLQTHSQTELVDITSMVQKAVGESRIGDGMCCVFIPHTTAGVTINENADASVRHDILMEMNKMIPFDDGYKHMEGNSAAHIKASIVGFSQNILVEDNTLMLGTWQGIYFCEFDGPRHRQVWVKTMKE